MFNYHTLFETIQGRLFVTLSIIVFLVILRYAVQAFINRRTSEIHRRVVKHQISNYLLWMAAFALIIPLWLQWFQSVFAVVSVIAVALVLVTRDVLVNLLAHTVIVWRALFSVGDRIQINDYIGDVVQIGPMYLTLAEIGSELSEGEPTGRVLKIPNSIVLNTPLANFSRGLPIVWSELSIELTLDSDWEKALQILLETGRTYSASVGQDDYDTIVQAVEEALSTDSKPSVRMKVASGRIILHLRYGYRVHEKRETDKRLWAEILRRIRSENDVTLYPGN